MTRAFVAVVPPDDVLDAVGRLAARVGAELPGTARLTARHQWHLTLQFLGDEADLDAVADALGALALRPGELVLGGCGAFPSERRARVVWLGVVSGHEWLAQASAAVGAIVRPLGHEPDAREYHPHLTLARLRAPRDVEAAIRAGGTDRVGRAFVADEIVLFESTTAPGGAQHRAHRRYPLS